jgi:tight adherence protein B
MFVFIVLVFAVGIILVARGFSEIRTEQAQSVALKISRRRQRADLDDGLSEHERDFAIREEARAAASRRTSLPTVTRMLSSNTVLSRLDESLLQARSSWRASELISASLMLALVVLIVTFYFGFGPLAFVFSALCFILPWTYVRFMRAKYYASFDDQLADTLMLMANGLRAGFSFLQTMEMISRESPPPISDEFARVNQEVSVGVPINDALQNLADRVQSMDLNLMVTAVVIQREVGGGLAEILETIANVINERMRIKREIKVLTTQGKWSGAILAAMPISIGILIHFVSKMSAPGDPSFIEPMLYDVRGQIGLAVALCLRRESLKSNFHIRLSNHLRLPP